MPVGRDVAGESDAQPAACSLPNCVILLRVWGAVSSAPTTLPGFLQNFERDKTSDFLEFEPRRRLGRLRRQHKGGTDIGVARERNFRSSR